jgi:septal ring factor EnvC (AmiA/AmiB activator)
LARFGKQRHPDLGIWVFNKGVEIGAPIGTPFKAVAAGKVLVAGKREGLEPMVVVDHGGFCYSVYLRAKDLKVAPGQTVASGQELGSVGGPGPLGPPSLFFEVTVKGKPIDPVGWLRRKGGRR